MSILGSHINFGYIYIFMTLFPWICLIYHFCLFPKNDRFPNVHSFLWVDSRCVACSLLAIQAFAGEEDMPLIELKVCQQRLSSGFGWGSSGFGWGLSSGFGWLVNLPGRILVKMDEGPSGHYFRVLITQMTIWLGIEERSMHIYIQL